MPVSRDDESFGNPEHVVPECGKEEEAVLQADFTKEKRKRTLNEKGYTYQLSVKTSNLKAEKGELIQQIRRNPLERGQSVDLCKFKRELSEVRVVYSVFQDIVDDIKLFVKPDEYLRDIDRSVEQVDREWLDFETDIKSEIKHLEVVEQQRVEAVSEPLRISSHSSKKSKAESIGSKSSSIGCAKGEKFLLQKEEATLKAKLAFVEEE